MAPSLIARARRRIGRALAGSNQGPVVLMYHRIAEPRYDPWGLSVAPDRFARQLRMLKTRRTVLPLGELVDRLEAGRADPRAAAITFDDGYADNALVAKPLLEQAGVPATMFLTSGFIGSEKPFWWDELADLVLGNPEAAVVEITLGHVTIAASWPESGTDTAAPSAWRAWNPPITPREAAYRTLWEALQELDAAQRDEAMAQLRARLPLNPERPPAGDLPMSATLAATLPSDLIAVGGHGRSHVPLTALPFSGREAEIAGGRRDLAALTGLPEPEGFAYPHGSWDAETKAIVERSGYRWAVTTRSALIDPSSFDRYTLPRIAVGNWDTRQLDRALSAPGK